MALARPIEAATSAVAPPSGMRPILAKASMKNAFELVRTRSADRATDTPTPAHGPCTTLTTGRGTSRTAATRRLAPSSVAASPPSSASSPPPPMSAPELKPRPAPDRTMTWTSGSVPAFSTASAMSSSTSAVTELSESGRLISMRRAPSSRVTRTWSPARVPGLVVTLDRLLSMDISNHVALVTGGASGLGRATVENFVEAGAQGRHRRSARLTRRGGRQGARRRRALRAR